jgi:hypothetical protein
MLGAIINLEIRTIPGRWCIPVAAAFGFSYTPFRLLDVDLWDFPLKQVPRRRVVGRHRGA